MVDLKQCNENRKAIKDLNVNGVMMSFEQLEKKRMTREKKVSKLLKEARKVLTRDQMCYYIDNGCVDKSWGVKLSRLPKELEVIAG